MDFAEQVKAQVDIVQTVRDYLPLRRNGGRFVAPCPFHTEKTPSFGVTPALGIFKCFGCGAGGDVIKFVMLIEGLTFWEALTALAERNGIPVPQKRDHDPESEMRAPIFEMYEEAARVYAQNLFGPPGGIAREYLQKRALSAATAQQFLLGFSEASWDALLKRFWNRYSPKQLEDSGLFGKREDGGFYDKFRGRLMFPIHNESGKVIGFGGRALRPDDEPKYLNSPETAIYKKSSVLYNLHRAKDPIRKGNRVILVEGYMDVIGVYAAGIRNVVASCGTALTNMQVRKMKQYSTNAVVNFDPDDAGQNATERSAEMFLAEGMHMRVLELEGGLDPDDYIKERGVEIYGARLERATNYFIWLADRARKKFGTASAEARMQGYDQMLLPAIKRIHDPLERASVATEVADYLGLDRNLVLAEFRKIPGQQQRAPRQPGAVKAPENTLPVRERLLVRTLVQDPEARQVLLPRLAGYATVRSFSTWPVVEAIDALMEEDPNFGYHLLESRLDEGMKSLLYACLFADGSNEVLSADQAELFAGLMESEDRELQYREVQRQMQAAERAGNLEEAMRLMQVAADIKRRIRSGTA